MRRQTYLLLLLVSLTGFRAFAGTRLEEYALILEGPPLARQISSRQALHSAVARSRLAAIQAGQQNLRCELVRRKIAISGSSQMLLNAVFVRVPRARWADLRALPGVKRVAWLPPLKRHLNLAVSQVGGTAAWNVLQGGMANAGAGVKIAIIDSGIDQTHPAFQDQSLSMPAGFPVGDTGYTNNKIIAARSYQATFALPDDPTPVDRSGHGTALAMIAAGETNAGSLATITGVAPKAWLGNYKVFGTPGVNDSTYASIVIQALEDAIADNMDIAVLALGSPALNGPLDTDPVACAQSGVPASYQDSCDVPATAVENAVALGLTVVVSAGNDAQTGAQPPSLNTINSPGTAPSAITVGASTNAHVSFAALEVNGAGVPAGLQMLDALAGDGVKLIGPLNGTLQDVSSVDSTGLACAALPAGSLSQDIVLIERGNCDFSTKINNAQQAGALAVVIYQSDPNAPPFSSLGARNTGIPAMMIAYEDGVALKSYLAANPGAAVTLNPALHEESSIPNLLTDSTSRGPSIDYSIKPDLVAVGQGIYTATEKLDPTGDLYDPTGYTTVDGSSFAAGMVAGAAALVKQANPGFTAGQIKSALVNTAGNSANDIADSSQSGEPLIAAVGGGKLNAAAALAPGATVEPASVSFGWVGPGSTPQPIALNIKSASGVTSLFAISISPFAVDQDTSDVLSISSALVQAPPGGVTVTLLLRGNFSYPGIYWGQINITGSGANLHVPYWYLASDGQPFDILPVYDANISGTVNDTCWFLAFKVVDQYGIAVPGVPVTFSFPHGAAQSTSASCPAGTSPGPATQTDYYGVGWTNVDLGAAVGDETFQGTAGGLSTYFFATVRPSPSISRVVDSASFEGKELAPGSYITIYGTGLSDATQTLSIASLPFSMAGVSVSFASADGTASWPGRLSYVSPTQINVQIPWELAGRASAKLYVNMADFSATTMIPIADDSPAMFTYGSNMAIAQDKNYHLVTASNPAVRGQPVIIYANGLGPVDHPPVSGELTPSQPLAHSSAVTVTIGGADAPVSFSGLTPGSIGLYQINVTVPQDAGSGLQPVLIMENGVTSQGANLPVQ